MEVTGEMIERYVIPVGLKFFCRGDGDTNMDPVLHIGIDFNMYILYILYIMYKKGGAVCP